MVGHIAPLLETPRMVNNPNIIFRVSAYFDRAEIPRAPAGNFAAF